MFLLPLTEKQSLLLAHTHPNVLIRAMGHWVNAFASGKNRASELALRYSLSPQELGNK